jgi:hypothetical protein
VDLLGQRFVLLTGARGSAWREATEAIARASDMPLDVVQIGGDSDVDDSEGTWATVYGIAADGAVLVRPDGHVAWRTPTQPGDPAGTLSEVLTRILAA